MALHKIYHQVEGSSYIKLSIHFNRSTHNWATGQSKQIGYECTVVPIQRSEDGMVESFTAFTGFNVNILQVERQSKKRLEEAIRIVEQRKEEFINYIKTKNF